MRPYSSSSKSSSDPDIPYKRITKDEIIQTCGLPKHASDLSSTIPSALSTRQDSLGKEIFSSNSISSIGGLAKAPKDSTKKMRSRLPNSDEDRFYRDESLNYTSNMENDTTFSGNSVDSYVDNRINSTNTDLNKFLTQDFVTYSDTSDSYDRSISMTEKNRKNKKKSFRKHNSQRESLNKKYDELLKQKEELTSQLFAKDNQINQLQNINKNLESEIITMGSILAENQQMKIQIEKLNHTVTNSNNSTQFVNNLSTTLNDHLQFQKMKQHRDLQDQKQGLNFLVAYENNKITKLHKQTHVLKKLIMIIITNLKKVAQDRPDYKGFKVKSEVIERILEKEIVTERDSSLIYKHLIRYLYC